VLQRGIVQGNLEGGQSFLQALHHVRRHARPGQVFGALPEEVADVVVGQGRERGQADAQMEHQPGLGLELALFDGRDVRQGPQRVKLDQVAQRVNPGLAQGARVDLPNPPRLSTSSLAPNLTKAASGSTAPVPKVRRSLRPSLASELKSIRGWMT
jgi:hypothetical protein